MREKHSAREGDELRRNRYAKNLVCAPRSCAAILRLGVQEGVEVDVHERKASSLLGAECCSVLCTCTVLNSAGVTYTTDLGVGACRQSASVLLQQASSV